jgi:hypothetical protein
MLDNKRYTRDAQIHGVGLILNATPYALCLSHLAPKLAEHWQLSLDDVKQFIYNEGIKGESDGRLTAARKLVQAQRLVLRDEQLTADQKLRRIEKMLGGRAETTPAPSTPKPASARKPPADTAAKTSGAPVTTVASTNGAAREHRTPATVGARSSSVADDAVLQVPEREDSP